MIFHFNTAFSRQLGLDDLGFSLLGGKNNLGSPAWWLVRLDLGVKVFFAISGMVLAIPFFRHYLLMGSKINLKDYFFRRLTRLEPPLIVSLFLFLCIHIFLLDKTLYDMLPHLGAGLLYFHMFIYGKPNPINPVTWSLETEAQFYILVPFFFALLFLYRSKLWYITILFFLTALSIVLKNEFILNRLDHLSNSLPAYFSNFAVGIVVAWLYFKIRNFFYTRNHLWDLFGIMAIISQFLFYKPQHIYVNNILFNASILAMMLSIFKGKLLNWLFTRPIIYIIGGMCYSIYLLHYAFFHLLVKYTANFTTGISYGLDLLLQLTIAIPSVLFISCIFYLLIEKPCMDKQWPEKLALRFQQLSKYFIQRS